jgi:uncharacterized protein YegL
MADIILILDESGSMGDQRVPMIKNVNELIQEQKKLLPTSGLPSERVNMHIFRFSSEVKPAISGPLMSFPEFTDKDYAPGGMTALNDAIGTVIDRFDDSHNRTVLVIATDGVENSSQKYELETVKAKLEKKKKAGWTIMYLSENLEKQGKGLGVDSKSNVSVTSLESGMSNKHFIGAVTCAVRGDSKGYTNEMACFSSTSKQ